MTDYSYDTFLNPLDALAFDIAQTTTENDQQNAAAELALWTNAQFTFDVKPGTGIFDDEKSPISSPIIKSPVTESVNPLETTIINNNNSTSTKNNNTSVDDNDPITYEKLVNYLDFELPQQQKKQQEQKNHHQQHQQYQQQEKFNPEGLVSSFNSQQQQESFPSTPISTVPNSPVLVPTSSNCSSPSTTNITINHPVPQQQPANLVGGRQILPKPVFINPLDLASLLIAPLQFNNNNHVTTTATNGLNLNALTSPILTPTINLTAKKPRKRSSTPTTNAATTGIKRERDESLTEEEILAEEDKRRRNTAASARFRVKKKLREQAMEQNVRNMAQKSEKLQERVNELELEIKLLRSLLTEKEMTTINNSA